MGNYSREASATLPTTAADLTTIYTDGEKTTVSTDDGNRVSQSASNEYAIHEFKVSTGGRKTANITWDGQSNIACSDSPTLLQIYNYSTAEWENVDSDDVTGANTDFTLTGSVPDTTNYESGGEVACRVYQYEAVMEGIFSATYNKTSGSVVELPILLASPAVANTTITIAVSGTAHPSVADYGVGKSYTPNITFTPTVDAHGVNTGFTATCNIAQGQTTPASPVTITIFNNPLFLPDLVATFTLTDSHSYALTYSLINITIHDDATPNYIDVTTAGAWGDACVGNGVTDDRAAFQVMLDYLRDNNGGVVYIPSGKTLLITPGSSIRGDTYVGLDMPCKQQITIAGAGHAYSGILAAVYANKFHLMETGPQYGSAPYYWSDLTADSPGLVFHNIMLDENGPNQTNWGTWYREQCFLLGLDADPGSAPTYLNKGRFKVIMDGCKIQNSLSDGVSIGRNIDITMYKCDGQDCTRGVPVVIGGYVNLDVRDCNFYSTGNCHDGSGVTTDMSLHWEPLYNPGYGGTSGGTMTVNNTYIENKTYFQNFNQAGEADDSFVCTMNNLTQTGYGQWIFELWTTSSSMTITNSTLLTRTRYISGVDATGTLSAIAGTVVFNNVKFTNGRNLYNNGWELSTQYPWCGHPFNASMNTGGSLELTDCEFTSADDYEVQVGSWHINLSNVGGYAGCQSDISITGAKFTGGYYNLLNLAQIGGTFLFDGIGGQIDALGGSPGVVFNNTNSLGDLAATYRNLTAPANSIFCQFGGNVFTSGYTFSYDFSVGVIVPQSSNDIRFYQSDHNPCYEGFGVVGGRTVQAPDNNLPSDTTTMGFDGDHYVLQNLTTYTMSGWIWRYADQWIADNGNWVV